MKIGIKINIIHEICSHPKTDNYLLKGKHNIFSGRRSQFFSCQIRIHFLRKYYQFFNKIFSSQLVGGKNIIKTHWGQFKLDRGLVNDRVQCKCPKNIYGCVSFVSHSTC